MQRENLQATIDHYNKHSAGGKKLDQRGLRKALNKSREGVTAPLRKFHNDIKKGLLSVAKQKLEEQDPEIRKRGCCLLDFACGRGRDVWKWIDLDYRYVKGLDISPGEIEDAKTCYQAAKETRMREGRGCRLEADFLATDKLGLEDYLDPKAPFDVVSCMFAIHFFFASEKSCKTFFKNVAANLKDGGYFVGTCPEGKRVLAQLKGRPRAELPLLKIQAKSKGNPTPHGWGYTFAIADTVTDLTNGEQEEIHLPTEYLVFQSAFTPIAAKYGLYPVTDYDQDSKRHFRHHSPFDIQDAASAFKHFAPSFPKSDSSLEVASACNMAFVFQKRSAGLPPPRPAPSRQEAASINFVSSSTPLSSSTSTSSSSSAHQDKLGHAASSRPAKRKENLSVAAERHSEQLYNAGMERKQKRQRVGLGFSEPGAAEEEEEQEAEEHERYDGAGDEQEGQEHDAQEGQEEEGAQDADSKEES